LDSAFGSDCNGLCVLAFMSFDGSINQWKSPDPSGMWSFLECLNVILEGPHSHVDRLMFYVYFLLDISA
jgi:hypothetical protein